MYYLLHGENDFFSHQKLQQIKNKFLEKNKSEMNILAFSGDFNLDEFKQALNTNSLWAVKKLIIAKNIIAEAPAEKQEKLLELLKENKDNAEIFIIFWEGSKPKKSGKLFKFLNKPQLAQEFAKPTPLQIRNWIIKEFQAKNAAANREVVSALEISSGNLYNIANEIEKLALYACHPEHHKCHPEAKIEATLTDGENNRTKQESVIPASLSVIPAKAGIQSPVTLADFNKLANPEINPNIFSFVDAIAQKNRKEIYNLITQFEKKEEGNENYLLSMFNYLFRNLIQIKELAEAGQTAAQITQKTKLHPFVVKKSLDQLRKFTLNDLKQIYGKLLETDTQVKTGQVLPKLALDLLVASI